MTESDERAKLFNGPHDHDHMDQPLTLPQGQSTLSGEPSEAETIYVEQMPALEARERARKIFNAAQAEIQKMLDNGYSKQQAEGMARYSLPSRKRAICVIAETRETIEGLNEIIDSRYEVMSDPTTSKAVKKAMLKFWFGMDRREMSVTDEFSLVCCGIGLWTLVDGLWPLSHPIFDGIAMIAIGIGVRAIVKIRSANP